MSRKDRLHKYIGILPMCLIFQLLANGLLWILTTILKEAASFLLWDINRSAFTSGDIPYLLRTWQGWIIAIIGFVILVCYTVFDIHVLILFIDNVLYDKKKRFRDILKEGVISVKYLIHGKGLMVVLFVSLFAPLVGAFIGISLTDTLYIPNFVTSYINSSYYLRVIYYFCVALLAILGILYLFTFHFMLDEKIKCNKAMYKARLFMQKYWKDFLKEIIVFYLKFFFWVISYISVTFLIPVLGVKLVRNGLGTEVYRFLLIFIGVFYCFSSYVVKAIWVVAPIMFMNRFYHEHTDKIELHIVEGKYFKSTKVIFGVSCLVTLLIAAVGVVDFESMFPIHGNALIIAHRAGGNYGVENTVNGLQYAIDNNCYGAEIDVQRTLDNQYVVYHDDNLFRLSGNSSVVCESTLDDLKKVKLYSQSEFSNEYSYINTIDEMLDAAKDKIHLYIELKGDTADYQMADDLYKKVKDKGMVDQVTFICLKYDVVKYIEDKYDVDTGYLCYASAGEIEYLNCDSLILEEETASDNNIARVQENGKQVLVWTINTYDSAYNFLNSDVNGIITDDYVMCQNMQSMFETQSDFWRIENEIFTTFKPILINISKLKELWSYF